MPTLWIIVFSVVLASFLLTVWLGAVVLERERKSGYVRMLRLVDPRKAVKVTKLELVDEVNPAKSGEMFLARTPAGGGIRRLIAGAGLNWSIDKFLLLSLVCAAAGAGLAFLLQTVFNPLLAVPIMASAGAMAPFIYLHRKRARRLRDFEAGFPDALEFMARAIRAGHAFSVSLELLASESPEPIKTEFRKVFNELNLGAAMDAALRALVVRVPLVDVKFFVSTVLLQRETGGNLAEVLTNLGHIIRERFKLKGHVRAVTAHGRLTAIILSAMPPILAIALMVRSPGYLNPLLHDPMGQRILLATVAAQVIGFFVIQKIVNIKV